MTTKHIIFFDGSCVLCNGFADFLLRRIGQSDLRVAPIQGETAKSILTQEQLDKYDSIIYFDNGQVLYKSTAVLRALEHLGGGWKLMRIFFIIPGFLRNLIYDFVARIRYYVFGKRDTCRLPSEKEKGLMLP